MHKDNYEFLTLTGAILLRFERIQGSLAPGQITDVVDAEVDIATRAGVPYEIDKPFVMRTLYAAFPVAAVAA